MEGPPSRQAPWRLQFRLLAPSLVMVVLVAMLAVNVVNVLGAVRAYVSGESLWSKSRSEAVQHLLQYAESREPDKLQAFHQALQLPEGDRLAREGMSRPHLDRASVRAHLITGGNHPDDVDNMIVLFRRFGDQWVFRDALADWVRGDQLIAQLKSQAAQLQQDIQGGAPEERIDARIDAILQINAALTTTERHFSASLGQAARVTEQLLIASVVVVALTVSILSIAWTRRTFTRQAEHQAMLGTINRRWELASASAGLGVYELDAATAEVHLDAKAAALHGLGDAPVVIPRAQLNEMVLQDDLEVARDAVDRALQSGEVFKMSYRLRRTDQVVRWLEATGRLVMNPRLQQVRVVGVVRDVTEERAQVEMAMKRDAAERVARAQREFLSRLSHELRTPLNAILGFAQLMLIDTSRALPPTQTRQTQLILTAGRQLLSLIEDVLDLSKVESGDIPMSIQAVDVCQSLRACLPLIDTVREKLNITLEDHLPTDALMAQADPQRLQQVLMNLLTNACKYNRPGGRVTLDGRLEGPHVVIDITDTGLGLSPDELGQLFQPFKRIAPQPEIEGTGLGLYIVRQLVERMGGQVSVHSRKGEGSCFTVRLPADLNPPQ
ncbi:MAG TPA: ATP-binding protein [Aquabacterium sp.]|uniref:sensor histidine kinase n=1 Tax=Aquabacterium sp. TaxID=1872578 RepID=UPI002E368225|nr:ATP-binding protein [Aquabacterium sp.]HEX5372826.1 ATP-binding protein [Aquabacterium sp.]